MNGASPETAKNHQTENQMDSADPESKEPSNNDHLVTKEEQVPNDEEQFAPDPATVPFLTNELLKVEKETDVFVDAEVPAEEKEEESMELSHKTCYKQLWKIIKELTGAEVLAEKKQ